MYVESFLLFITKRSTVKELELTQKPLKINIEWVNLDIRSCNKMLMWTADYHSHSIMNNNLKPLKPCSGSAISTLIGFEDIKQGSLFDTVPGTNQY